MVQKKRTSKKYSKAGFGFTPRKTVNKEGSYYDKAHWLTTSKRGKQRFGK